MRDKCRAAHGDRFCKRIETVALQIGCQGHFVFGETRCDVLRTVPVERGDGDGHDALRLAAVSRQRQPFGKLRPFADRSRLRMTQYLQPFASRIIHQEQRHTIIMLQVSGGQELTVATKIKETERRFVKHFHKASGPAAMLDIGPASFADTGHIQAVARGNERGLAGGQAIVRRFAGLGTTVNLVAAVDGLQSLHRRGHRNRKKCMRHAGLRCSPANMHTCSLRDNWSVLQNTIAILAIIMDRFAAMRAFVSVAERGGFAAAAREMRRTPSSVTRAIQELEADLGVQLFMRSTRSVRLTDAGARYLVHARRIQGDLDAAERDVRETRETPSGRVVITAPSQFGRLHVRPAISRFLARYGDVGVQLRLDDRVISLVDEGVDVAVRIGPLADSSLVARRVGWVRRMLVAAPAYLQRRGVPVAAEDLLTHDIAGIAGSFGLTEWRVGQTALRLRPRFATDSIDTVVGHVIDGGGIAFLLSYQVAEAVRSGRLVELLAGQAPAPVPVHLVYPPARQPGLAARTLIDMIAQDARWNFSAP